jgi:AcrR family transcriptional regulator
MRGFFQNLSQKYGVQAVERVGTTKRTGGGQMGGRGKSGGTRQAILSSAIKLFLTKSYESASIAEICAAAKLTKPTFYTHFTGKNHLLYEVHMKSVNDLLKPHIEKAESIDDPMLRLRTLLRDYTCMTCSHPELRFLLHGSLSIRDKYAKGIKKEWRRHYEIIQSTVKQLQSAGAIDSSARPSWVALLLLGMISWVTYWFDYSKGGSGKNGLEERQQQSEGLADLVEEIVFHGLMKEAPPPALK